MKCKRNYAPDDLAQKSLILTFIFMSNKSIKGFRYISAKTDTDIFHNEDGFFGKHLNSLPPVSISDGCIHLKYGDLYTINLNVDLL